MLSVREALNRIAVAPTDYTYSEREALNVLAGKSAPDLHFYSEREAANVYASTTGHTIREALNAKASAPTLETYSIREALNILVP